MGVFQFVWPCRKVKYGIEEPKYGRKIGSLSTKKLAI